MQMLRGFRKAFPHPLQHLHGLPKGRNLATQATIPADFD
jgi:hypothetical protein